MRSSGVVVVDVSLEDTTEMSLIEHQDMVEHFVAHATHPVLCKKSIHAIQIGKEIFSAKEKPTFSHHK